MDDNYDLVIRNSKIRSRDKLVNIGVLEDEIVKISKDQITGSVELDAEGNLVTETFVNPHLHMDKVFTLQKLGEESIKLYQDEESGMGGAMNAIKFASKVKEDYDESWIYKNAERALKLGIKNGVLHHRAFVDIDNIAKLEGMKALLKLRDKYEEIASLKVVAFPQEGVIKEPGTEDLIEESVKMGADVVGGIPWVEDTDIESQKHIDKMFRIATEYDKDVAMLTDDAGDPSIRTTEMLGIKTLKEGWEGRVTACHARAMAKYPELYFNRLTELLKRAKISIVSDPQTGPIHARVEDLLKSGVNVALGQDDIADAYYPYGRNSMLEVAFLSSHLLWDTTRKDMEILYDMITKNGAKSLSLSDYGLKKGCKADLVILNDKNVYNALRNQETPRKVISNGKIVAETDSNTKFHLN